MRESRLSGSVEGVLRNPDPYSDSVRNQVNAKNLLQKVRHFILRRIFGNWPAGSLCSFFHDGMSRVWR
jgi:hypothetical protein